MGLVVEAAVPVSSNRCVREIALWLRRTDRGTVPHIKLKRAPFHVRAGDKVIVHALTARTNADIRAVGCYLHRKRISGVCCDVAVIVLLHAAAI